MKITIDMPDSTLCCFLNFVKYTDNGLAMQAHSITSDELYDGSEVMVKDVDKGGDSHDD